MRRFLAGAALALALALPAYAAVPKLLTNHGRLLDGSDQGVNGDLEITFTIYAFPQAPFGEQDTQFWTEKKTVKVSNGIYAVVLGDTAGNPLPDSVFSSENRFLGIKIGSGEELSPRLRMTSVPFAIEAGDAGTLGGRKPADYWQKADAVEAASLGGKAPGEYWQKADAVDAATLGSKSAAAFWQKTEEVDAATLGGKPLSGLWQRSDAVEAATLGGNAPGAFWQKSEAVNAATFNGKDATNYWQKSDSVNAVTLNGKDATGYWQKSDAVNAATFNGKDATNYWQKSDSVNAAKVGGVDAANFARIDLAPTFSQGLVVGQPASKPACGGGSGSGLVIRDAATGGMQACDGTRWVSLTKMPGLTRATAMASCAALRDAGAAVSGTYWINPGGTLMQVYCEQELEGGGWALVHNSVASSSTSTFWNIPYAQRFQQKGAPGILANHYNGALYKLGTSYMDVVEDLNGNEAVGFVATTTGINQTTMRFNSPAKVKGDSSMYGCHFAAGWSAPDYDGDDASNNCAQAYGNVTQHYCACWNTNLAADAEGSVDDSGWGPHSAEVGTLGIAGDGSNYSRVRRVSRFARW